MNPNYSAMPQRPAGGVWTSAHDLMRYVELEVLYDGEPEAQGNLDAAVASFRAGQAKHRGLHVPAAPAETAELAAAYHGPELGDLAVRKDGAATVFDVGEWRSEVASYENNDGTTSFMTISPGLDGFEFVTAERGGRRALVVRDRQHEYIFSEVSK
jgi:hypothetical protein